MRCRWFRCGGVILLLTLLPLVARGVDEAETPPEPAWTTEQLDFFESKVRPLLVEKCHECHSAAARGLKGGLKLDARDAILRGGDSGPSAIPGKPEDSLLIQAIRWQSLEMPPAGKLSAEEVELLTRWVQQGLPWPRGDAVPRDPVPREYDWPELREQHWAWKPVSRPPLPEVRDTRWPRNPIDHFILAGLEAVGLPPAPPADAHTLVRRVYFDLTGLPPTPDDVADFVLDSAHDPDAALGRLVDRLLALPQYGERWGRHWLDVARYSDLAGNFGGPGIPHAWRYRDWVITALNQDLPYDQFLQAQIAGDLSPSGLPAATGFFALGPTYVSDGGDPDAAAQAQSETLDDRVDTLTRGILGLTVSCARCHDHKFDPIPQLDYYSLAGVFNNVRLADHPLVEPAVVAAYQDHQQRIQAQEQQVRAFDERAKKENRELSDAEKVERAAAEALLNSLRGTAPPMYPVAHGLADSGASDMPLAIRGNLRKPGPVAPRRFLRILAGEAPPGFTRGSGRLDLAEAIASPGNPLTARVFVNRVWLQRFGRGLVRTPSNFGTQGEPPTHPALLDWLAAEFQSPGTESGAAGPAWSIKRLHRLMLLSATYRMSGRGDPRGREIDADNRLVWRIEPRRLDVEAWRDALLAVTGELDHSLGGPSVGNLLTSPRRTLYGTVNRNGDQVEHQTFLRLFDFPPSRASSEGRTSSSIPQQYLFLLNSRFMADRARALTRRIQSLPAGEPQRIASVYQWLYSRPPTEAELQIGVEFLAQPGGADPANQLGAWEQYAQVLLSANELLFVE